MALRWRKRWAVGIVALAATLVAGSLAAASVPAFAADGAESPGRGFTQFRLSAIHGPGNPNALNLARAASKPAPLLLFLPATGAVPQDYRDFLETAADTGYSVLGLDYFNRGRSVAQTCGADADCYTLLQRNRFSGRSPSRFSRVDASTSIQARLRDALGYLEHHDRKGGWDRYLNGSSIQWKNIVLAGHSQGGGESAFISHYHRVRGVLMFSSPVETFEDVSASWMSRPGVTPVARMYGFDNVHDMYFDRIVGTWRKLGMGDPDAADAPHVPTGSHVMLSSLYVGTPREAHGRSVSDGTVRGANGVPRYEKTWRWMLAQVY
jgi:hypothetical protein